MLDVAVDQTTRLEAYRFVIVADAGSASQTLEACCPGADAAIDAAKVFAEAAHSVELWRGKDLLWRKARLS